MNDHSSRRIVANTFKQPTRVPCRRQVMDTYLVLLHVEFTLPCTVTSHAVRSYRTLSPLPRCIIDKQLITSKAVCSLLHLSSGYPAQPLAGTLPYVARTFLPFSLNIKIYLLKTAIVWFTKQRIITNISK